MSNILLKGTSFHDIQFIECKLLGVEFGSCNQSSLVVTFQSCLMDLSSFFQCKMKKTLFNECSLKEVSFIQTDLREAIFHKCNLSQAIFHQSILEESDFSTAYNYTIDPSINKLKKAIFSQAGIAGLLATYEIDIKP